MVLGGKDATEGLYRIDPATGQARLKIAREDLGTMTEGAWSADGKIHFNRSPVSVFNRNSPRW